MTDTAAVAILTRAKQRISAHGFDPNETPLRQGQQPRRGFMGYSVLEAVYGLNPIGEPTEAENRVLGYLEDAIATLHPETVGIEAFNAASGRTRDQVINVFMRAINLAKAADDPDAEEEVAAVQPLPNLGPEVELAASDGMEGIVTTHKSPVLTLVSSPEPEQGGGNNRDQTPFLPAQKGNAP
jgi:hypothetical protein